MKTTYNRARFAEALRDVGVREGDVVFSHSNIGYFGYPEEGRTADIVFQTILGAFFDVLGPSGTLVVPSFTYSFCNGQTFNPVTSPSNCGLFCEMVRRHPDARRSHDPIFSVAALGKRAEELTANVPVECFGRDSFWNRFHRLNGLICNQNFDAGSTYLHYVERCLNVPYRYDKTFTGQFEWRGGSEERNAIFFCRKLTGDGTMASFELFDKVARARGVARTNAVGRGALVTLRAKDAFQLLEDELPHQPFLLTIAGREPITQKVG